MSLPTPTPHQMGAVKAAYEWWKDKSSGKPPFYLAGYAGTGKSFLLPVIIDHLGLDPEEVAYMAPTGKAAKVMTEKLRAFDGFKTISGRTIHSWVYHPRPLKAEVLEKDLEVKKAQRSNMMESYHQDGEDWKDKSDFLELERTIAILMRDLDKSYDNVEGPNFQLNVDSGVRNMRLVVIDEGSMVGVMVAEDLKSFDIPIFVMGDPGQLPPVGEAAGFTDAEPDYQLTEIHRQALDSPIIRVADLARRGEWLKVGYLPGLNDDEWVNLVERRHDKATLDPDRCAQIIVGTNRKRWDITHKLRRVLGYRTTGPCDGERLIVCKNSRTCITAEGGPLVNGSFVWCTQDVGDLPDGNVRILIHVEDETGTKHAMSCFQGILEEHIQLKKGAFSGPKSDAFRARITSEHVDFGHAITCHKSQGSQWEETVVHDESGVFRDDAAKWLYTAVTRAEKRMTVVL